MCKARNSFRYMSDQQPGINVETKNQKWVFSLGFAKVFLLKLSVGGKRETKDLGWA